MSNKPVNFYQGAKGTFKVGITGDTSGEETLYKATHTYNQIKQAIEDGFIPYCKITGGDNNFYYHLSIDIVNDDYKFLRFVGQDNDVYIGNDGRVELLPHETVGGFSTRPVRFQNAEEISISANSVQNVLLSPPNQNWIPPEGSIFNYFNYIYLPRNLNIPFSMIGINESDASVTIQNLSANELVFPRGTIQMGKIYVIYE